jgi:hypothetical protein
VDAFAGLINGQNDILFGVDFSDELLETAKNSGINLVKRAVTREAFVFLINTNNPVQSLTAEQIKGIYSGTITNWSEVGGDDAPVRAFQRNSDSGSQIRMVKFMGGIPLMVQDVEYMSGMGFVIEQIADYDEGKYSVAYNMYTFTEKQYPSDEVVLLAVNGVLPDDDTIFDGTYPIVIYNYIYHDANNTAAAEFADNLYAFLMSDEGQRLISGSGYVNLNMRLDRNRNVDAPPRWLWRDGDIGYYNPLTGEFYAVDYSNDTGELLIFANFADYVLRDSSYRDNGKARDFLTFIYNSDFPLNPNTAALWEAGGVISLYPWMSGVLDPQDFFNFRFDGMYYADLRYYIDEDRFVLYARDQDTFDGYFSDGGWHNFTDGFYDYVNNHAPDSTAEITMDDFKNLYIRTPGWNWSYPETDERVDLGFYNPFNN